MFWQGLSAVGLVISLGILVTAAWLEPDPAGYGTHTQLGLPPCSFFEVNGVPCPTCGLTTSFAAMARGWVPTAWRANPVGVFLFCLTAAAPLWFGHALYFRQDPMRCVTRGPGRWLIPLGVVLLGLRWFVVTG